MPPIVLTAQFAHETNTFNDRRTGFADFKARIWVEGTAIREQFHDTNTEIGGFIDAAETHGFDLVPVVAANAGPSGLVTADVVESVTEKLTDAVRRYRPDGILLALHGAMVTELDVDGEGALLAALRDVAGYAVPIAVTLDLHANVSDRMVALADIVTSYRTYPHVDLRETGARAGALLARTMSRAISPKTIVGRKALLEGCDDGRTGVGGQMDDLLALARKHEEEAEIFDVSINAGFADADIPWAGPSVTVVGNAGAARAGEIADALMQEIWRRRDNWSIQYLSPADAVARAIDMAGPTGPVVIADYADNPGGGGYGDATDLLRAMLAAHLENAAFGALYDPAAVAAMAQAGLGAEITLEIGGKTDAAKGGAPLTVDGAVRALSDGSFTYGGPMLTGSAGSLGPCGTLRVGGIDVLICSTNTQMLDQEIFRTAGIEPTDYAYLAVKSMHHFRGAFAPIASDILVCDSGALCSPDRTRLTYSNIRRPIYPLDPIGATISEVHDGSYGPK